MPGADRDGLTAGPADRLQAVGGAIVALDSGLGHMSEYNSFQLERTQAGSIQGKYIDSSGSAKSCYVTVRNGRYEADHEVSLAEYNAAKVGADFPIVLTDSDSVKTDEAQEQADNAQADSAKSQAAERQNNAYWQWFWTHQLLTNMSEAGE